MKGEDIKVAELWGYAKDLWGVLSFVSMFAGPAGLFFVPIVPSHAGSAALWGIAFSLFGFVLIYQSLWKPRKQISCWWAGLGMFLVVLAAGVYSYLFDRLPSTRYPVELPTFTQHVLSVAYGLIFGLITIVFGTLRVCRPVE